MSTQMKITYAWLAAGIIFGVVGIIGLVGGSMGSLLTLGMAGLIIWTSLHNAGGWQTIKYDLQMRIRLFNHKPPKKKRNGFKVVKK